MVTSSRRKTSPRTLLFLLAVSAAGLLQAQQLHGQVGAVTGRVINAETRAAVASANVELLGSTGTQVTGVLSNAQGQFRLQAEAGTYAVLVTLIGFEATRVDGVSIAAGGNTNLEIEIRSRAFALNPIVVTASRREEKALEAPASVSIVGTERIQERAALSPVEHVRVLPGVDVVQTGLQQNNVVTRGFNNVFSGSLLVITDNRYASVPSLRFNAYNLIPLSSLDLERIEVVLGPGAALYGPNSASGVMHMITPSPIDDPGTRASIAGGERSVFHGAFRHGVAVSDRFGLKVSGQYFQGNDWEFRDPVELSARENNPGNPLIAARDFDAKRWGGEVRMDYRPWDDGEWILSGGVNQLVSSIEMTGVGGAQASDWRYSYLQSRLRKGRLFAQVFGNFSNAGDTYLLRTGESLVDESRMIVGQLQHGLDVGARQSFTYGLDLQHTDPRTGGTITGRNEDDNNINEVGGYLHSETRLTDRLDLVAAVRVDHHSRLEDLVFSPRAAIVFRPAPEQNLRFTFNRAFSTPSTNNLFLDLLSGRIPVGPVGYDVRVRGVPASGFTFNMQCAGGLNGFCMQSPFAPGQSVPANAALVWSAARELVLGSLVQSQQIPAQLADVLRAQLSDPGQAVGTVFRRLDPETGTFPLDAAGPQAIAPIRPTITNTFEVGYKGLVADRILLSADVYHSRVRDFIGPLRVETPHVFLEPGSVGAYLTQQITPLVQAGVLSQAQAAGLIQGMTGGFAQIPLGIVAPDQSQDTDLILTYRNFGDVDLWGADLGAQILLTDALSLQGSYSWVNDDCFSFSGDEECRSAQDIALNAPQNKGAAALRYQAIRSGVTVEGRVRFTQGFPMNSGVYIGDVEGYTVFDANLGYRIPMLPSTTVTVSATNITDNQRREFVGAPEVGRMVLLRLQYGF
ncbi:MAG: TonB-dependent receptor [Gemmatimonadota bacterium]